MDNKVIIAIAVVAVLAIAGTATYFVLSNGNDEASYDAGAFQIVSRVNSEGSGLYIDTSVADLSSPADPIRISNGAHFFGANYALSADNKAAWGGLVLGDPGSKSIQHTQLASIADKVGLKFEAYTQSTVKNDNTLYYVSELSNAGAVQGNDDIQGGIIWEPQYQKIIQEQANYKQLARTNEVFKGHTCCVIAANHDWLKSNSDNMVKFLAGYTKAVDFINNAKNNPTGDDYTWLVAFAKTTTANLTDEEVTQALTNIQYLYADDSDGSLDKLTDDVKALSTDLKDLGVITSDKFNDAGKLSKAFVDDSYMKDAVAGKAKTEGTSSITVAAINGDIHQLAIHVAKEKGYFADYGLDVNVSKVGNGNAVAETLISGDATIGFLGAPPATIYTINGNHILV